MVGSDLYCKLAALILQASHLFLELLHQAENLGLFTLVGFLEVRKISFHIGFLALQVFKQGKELENLDLFGPLALFIPGNLFLEDGILGVGLGPVHRDIRLLNILLKLLDIELPLVNVQSAGGNLFINAANRFLAGGNLPLFIIELHWPANLGLFKEPRFAVQLLYVQEFF